ncbi:MAG: hypothetical protein U1F27_01425 [Turneriella sp.]
MLQLSGTNADHKAFPAALWLLQCLVHCAPAGRGASLRDLIAFGDYINHAVFVYGEFYGALGLLLAMRIAFVRRGRIFLAKKFHTELFPKNAKKKPISYSKERSELEKILRALPAVTESVPVKITRSEFAQAAAAYLKQNA